MVEANVRCSCLAPISSYANAYMSSCIHSIPMIFSEAFFWEEDSWTKRTGMSALIGKSLFVIEDQILTSSYWPALTAIMTTNLWGVM